MIKIILSDIDGTFLKDDKHPAGTPKRLRLSLIRV